MNKKLLSFFAVLAIFTMFAVPVLTLAQQNAPTQCTITKDVGITGCDKGDCIFNDSAAEKPCAICCLFNTLYTVIDWIFAILMVVVALMIILGAVTFVTSAGDPTKTATAKNYILWAVIGLVVALFAKAVPPLVKLVMGVKSA
ncbi:MAG: pilin [Candidatus Paceibacterota bacterium]